MNPSLSAFAQAPTIGASNAGFSLERRRKTDPHIASLGRHDIPLPYLMRFTAGEKSAILFLLQNRRSYEGRPPKLLLVADRDHASAVFGFPGDGRIVGSPSDVFSQLSVPLGLRPAVAMVRREFLAFQGEWSARTHRLPVNGIPLLSPSLQEAGFFVWHVGLKGISASLKIAHVQPGTDYRSGQRIGRVFYDASAGVTDIALTRASSPSRERAGWELLKLLGDRTAERVFSGAALSWMRERFLTSAWSM